MPETFHDLPIPFPIFRYITGAEHLHFGLWEPDDGEDFVGATQRMADRVKALLPPAPAYVLDVGCGLGGTSVQLVLQGYRVLGLAPSDALIRYARGLAREHGAGDQARFESMGVEELDPAEGPFDGILFQESLQYVRAIQEVLAGLGTVLKPGGRIVITDQVRRSDELKPLCQFHSREEILAAAEGAGLHATYHEDVTDRARPTVSNSLRRIKALRDDLIQEFQENIPDIAHHVDVCLEYGAIEADYYEKRAIGYEFFILEQ